MRLVGLLGIALLVAVLGVASIGASAALGTTICKESKEECSPDPGKAYPSGTTVEATSANSSFFGDIAGECEASTAKVITSAEVGKPLGGEITKLSFTGTCEPCDAVTVEKLPHAASLEASGGGKGTLVVAVQVAFSECPFGINCVFGSKAVTLDVASEPAVLIADKEELTRKLGSEIFCGSSEKWSGEYAISSPKPFWLANTKSGAALCKEGADECPFAKPSAYPANTTIEAKSLGEPIFLGAIDQKCKAVTMKVTTTAESGKPLAAQISGLSFSECTPCSGVTAEGIPSGAELEASGTGTGTLKASFLVKLTPCPLGAVCTYEMTGAVAEIKSEPAELTFKKQKAVRSGSVFCGSTAEFDAHYLVTSPEPFWLSKSP